MSDNPALDSALVDWIADELGRHKKAQGGSNFCVCGDVLPNGSPFTWRRHKAQKVVELTHLHVEVVQ